ncbi:hypothetical protein EDD90_4071 [Streptomyces sp. Ag109_O5-1]|nr:hypothetical protein EDD90_4071 [Streptomyces sp. Ag109_O5-1]
MTNAPFGRLPLRVAGMPGTGRITWENGRIAAAGVRPDLTGEGVNYRKGVRYFTGRWYEAR